MRSRYHALPKKAWSLGRPYGTPNQYNQYIKRENNSDLWFEIFSFYHYLMNGKDKEPYKSSYMAFFA